MRNYRRITIPSGANHPNLIEGLYVYRPFQVVQTDLTYFYLNDRYYYIVFVIDVYTRLIVGHAVNNHRRAEANISALERALKTMDYPPWGLVFHSDHGSQYSSHLYLNRLGEANIHAIMGDVAWENPYAERINWTIKNEYPNRWTIKDINALVRKTNKAVQHYNTQKKTPSLQNEIHS